MRRSGRERVLTGKLKDFIFSNLGLPANRFSVDHDEPGTSSQSKDVIKPENQQGLAVKRQSDSGDPRTPKEALAGADAVLWKTAMNEEYLALMKNDTWELVDLPPGRNAIGCKWLFKTKQDETGKVIRHKARLVAQGFTQKFGVDFDEVFAPVAKQVTFRTLLTVASRQRMIVKHVDVKTAYLNGELEDTKGCDGFS